MIGGMSEQKTDRTMPVWLAVGVALMLLGVLIDPPLRAVLLLAGLLAAAYGVGQYLRENRRR